MRQTPTRTGARAGVRVAAAVAALGFSAGLRGAEPGATSAYAAVIEPMLVARCAECHGEKKQKARLALHTWEALNLGSDAGPVLHAGKPKESPLLGRMRLPLHDEEHMPPSDRAQPAPEEIELLERWIFAGANRGASLADLRLTAAQLEFAAGLPAKLAALARADAEPAWELDAAAVARRRAPHAAAVAVLQEAFPGALGYESRTAATLRFNAAGFGARFDDAALARLLPLAEVLADLDLAGTGVTDACGDTLARFRALRVLRLTFTAIGDRAMQSLGAADNLATLAVHGTKVTDASIAAWRSLPALKRLHVGETAAVDAAVAAGLPVVR